MIEETITDGLGNEITLKYDDTTDQVSIRNTGIDGEFRFIYLNTAMLDPADKVITIFGIDGPEEWENFTDNSGRVAMQVFWDTNKVDKETRGL
jgi:hypothetical protein